MNLESFPNEILLYLFEFLDDVHIFQAFYGLNNRFNSLLFSSSRNYHFDFQSISKNTFSSIFSFYICKFPDRITSIRFSNNDELQDLIQHLFCRSLLIRSFSNLRLLSFDHMSSYETIKEIISECHFIPHLTYLRFNKCYMSLTNGRYQLLIDNIWQIPKLIRCHVDISFHGRIHYLSPTITSSYLKYLTIQSVNIQFSDLLRLIIHTPHLTHLSIEINEYFMNDISLYQLESIVSLKLYARDASFAIEKFLTCMPNLRHLTIELLNTYLGKIRHWLYGRYEHNSDHYTNIRRDRFYIEINGYQWKKIIVNHLPKLNTFQLKMKEYYWNCDMKENHVDTLLQSFSTNFWIRDHRWFVRCKWINDQQWASIYLYTLPHSFDRYTILHPLMLSKSTSPNEIDYWCCDHLQKLQ
ncbi:hypothetical protein I4U23_010839 [Adineta vaga]|nr:hypothetical protein I4U23_010839 [Adineta vaga]